MQPTVKIAEAAARKAGKIIIQAMERRDSISITEKSPNDFATEVDRAAEEEIIKQISKTYPDHKIIGEESGWHGPEDSTDVWIIDPLDGTTNYIHGLPHFCVSIALLKKDKIEHGVIYDPIRDEMFTASRGHGAKLNGRRLRVTTNKYLENSLIGTGYSFRNPELKETYMKTFQALLPKAGDIRRTGSAALDLAYVASGRLDGFWELKLEQWDIAAGALMVKEAGGLVSDAQGNEKYMESGNIVAANPKIFKSMLQIIMPCVGK